MNVFPEHDIYTVQDFVNVATIENIDFLLADFRNFLMLVKLNNAHYLPFDQKCFKWIDDMKNDININLKKNDWTKEETDELINSALKFENCELNPNGDLSIDQKIIFELPKYDK